MAESRRRWRRPIHETTKTAPGYTPQHPPPTNTASAGNTRPQHNQPSHCVIVVMIGPCTAARTHAHGGHEGERRHEHVDVHQQCHELDPREPANARAHHPGDTKKHHRPRFQSNARSFFGLAQETTASSTHATHCARSRPRPHPHLALAHAPTPAHTHTRANAPTRTTMHADK
jgi:hypothetical protein